MQQNSINLLELLFTSILRNDSAYYQFSSYESGPDYAPILRYIQSHYQTITLKLLTEKFNYAIPYLSKVIKDCTGKNFSQLVKEQRMREAIKRITETNESIEQIAYTVGYNSADHFARVFREFYNISPRQYRTKYRVNGEVDLF